jgi:pimeloyl-ACP methyl ester carboxylesterase
VHVPPGFDATRRAGLVLYFHGWNGCVEAVMADEDTPCSEGGEPRTAARLATQMDEARVNALLVAVELRADASTGEPGQLALFDDARELLRELFTEHLAAPLGCTLELEDLDRVVLVAHSGGYQAAASTLEFGGLPRVTEVILLDALYGADDVFTSWLVDPGPGPGPRGPRRFVGLYTCCGLPFERSHALARAAEKAGAGGEGQDRVVVDDEGDADARLQTSLTHPVVFALVGAPHDALPRTYFRLAVEAAGFAPMAALK